MKKTYKDFTTWEEVCEQTGFHPVDDLPFPKPETERQEATNAYFKSDIIAELFNGDVILDWQNGSQKKWAPWIYDYKSGSGWSFVGSSYDWTFTNAAGGARLRFATEAISDHFAKYFMDIINILNKPITKK